MKYLLTSLMCILVFSYCKKSGDVVRHIHCDGIFTDTSGTNDNGRVYMPNAFTPNNDGLNEIAKPFTYNIASLTFTVYDLNNNVLFSTAQLNNGWTVPADTAGVRFYYYGMQAVTTSGRHIGDCGTFYSLRCFPSGISDSTWRFEDELTPLGFTGVSADSLPDCP